MRNIGLTGKAMVGKTTAAKYLAARFSYNHTSFATPLKQIARQLWDLNPDNKTDIVPTDPPRTVREILQLLGTEVTRQIDRNAWVNFLDRGISRVSPGAHWVVDDVRFQEEAEMLVKRGFVIVRIERPDAPKLLTSEAAHASENQMVTADVKIINDGTEDDLFKQILAVALS